MWYCHMYLYTLLLTLAIAHPVSGAYSDLRCAVVSLIGIENKISPLILVVEVKDTLTATILSF